ncbi:ATP-binding protein [Pedobacter gandavensis]|uniref:ATP-binding protein n=1 Tax=Pedobacter gandavensis TaxID=2679963 RepID=UPI00292FDD7D|nr:ATP-binding protein [Pedobacter gandavensis]
MQESIILSPPPVFFIKSISEQGYTLSTAISDLVDNSIAAGAKRIEILLDTTSSPLRLFIADNGGGMSPDELNLNMRFPSADLDVPRGINDLGRFGLGLKTASFSQSRKFTVLSKKSSSIYSGRSWDVEHLRETNNWSLIINSDAEVSTLISEFYGASKNFHQQSIDFQPNTLIVWDCLYKLEKVIKKHDINDELDELRSHLGLVFHRFIQNGVIQIRLNNSLIEGFEPFPNNVRGVQTVSENFWETSDAYVKFQGIVLPKRSATEAKEKGSDWVPEGRTLEELQGIYVYRNDRLINYGGWLRAIPKSIYLQFGRIKIDITNINDEEFHLNVAKSSLKIPFGLKKAMSEMVNHVAAQALKEYRERMASAVIRSMTNAKGLSIILRETNSYGPRLRINSEFEIFRKLKDGLSTEKNEILNIFVALIESKLNEIWKGEISTTEIIEDFDNQHEKRILKIKKYYEEAGYSLQEIKELLLDSFGQTGKIKILINSLTMD